MQPLRYIHALRPVNLLMTVYIMVSVKYGLLTKYEGSYEEPAYYFVYIFSVLCVMAFGYLVNDYHDVETDRINKPGRNIFVDVPAGYIWVSGSVCVFLGLAPVMLLMTMEPGPFMLFPFGLNVLALILLFIYAKGGKSTVLWGNLHIAFLGCLLIWASFFAAGQLLIRNDDNLNITFFYAVFSFLATLLREIVKDAEDVDGDTRSGIRTLATQYGIKYSRYIGGLVNTMLVAVLVFTARNCYLQGEHSRTLAFLVLAVYGIFTLFILWQSHDKAGFRRTSSALKIYMILGITSMWL